MIHPHHMIQYARKRLFRPFFAHSLRLRIELLILVLALGALYVLGLELVNVKAAVYKLLLVTIGVLYAHISRHFIWPYIDVSDLIWSTNGAEKVPANLRAAAVFGVFFFMGMVVLAFMVGL